MPFLQRSKTGTLSRASSKEMIPPPTPSSSSSSSSSKDSKDKSKKRLSMITKGRSLTASKGSSSSSCLSLSRSSSCSSIAEKRASAHITTINGLTDDCMRHFFSVFPVLERLKLRKICSKWRTLIYETISELVVPSKCTERMDDFSLHTIYDTLGELKAVSLPAMQFSLWGLRSLLHASNLHSITITYAPPGSLRVVAEELGPRLLKLDWHSKHPLDSDAIYVGTRCLNLLSFKINLACIGDDGLGYMRTCTKLTHLALDTDNLRSLAMPKFTVGGLQYLLSELRQLEYLECPGHSTLINIVNTNCRRLKQLRLDGLAYYYLPHGAPLWASDPEFNVALVNLTGTLATSLQSLHIRHCNALSHEGWLAMARNCRLLSYVKEEFRAGGHNFMMNGASMMALAGFCPLLKIYISGGSNVLVDNSIEILMKSCPNLEELWLGESPLLTDVAFAHWPPMKHLRLMSFPIRNNTISDGSVGFVVDACPNLEEIHLRPLMFTDKCLKHLVRGCRKLKYIEFGNDARFTVAGIDAFLRSDKKKFQLEKAILPKKYCEHWDPKKYPHLKTDLR